MNKESAPTETDEVKLGPLDIRTVLLLDGVENGLKARGYAEPSSEEWFELASQVGLGPVASKHRSGKPVTGNGGTPVVDWIFCSAPHRSDARYSLEIPLMGMRLGDNEAWIRDLVSPLTLWMLDLPASESSHHAYPHGLLDHVLEVALAAAMESESTLGHKYYSDELPERTFVRALRLSVTLGLLHDIGKVFHVEVKDQKSGEIWDPMREPLAYFKVRHEIPILEPTSFKFVKGRGLNGHEDQGKKLLPRVVHPRIWKRMGFDIVKAYNAYAGRYETPQVPRPAPLDFVADCVHRADGASASKSRAKGSKPGEYLLELQAKAAKELA